MTLLSQTFKTRGSLSPVISSRPCANRRPFHDLFTISCIYVLNLPLLDRTRTSFSMCVFFCLKPFSIEFIQIIIIIIIIWQAYFIRTACPRSEIVQLLGQCKAIDEQQLLRKSFGDSDS